jgi:hypothetical protein
MLDRERLAWEIDRNLEFFETKLPELLSANEDRFALLHDQQIVGIYDSLGDAQTAGEKLYPDGIFSIQKVTEKPLELGAYSYAVHLGNPQ